MSNDTDHYKGWSIDVSAMPYRADPTPPERATDFIPAIFLTKHIGETSESHQLTMGRTFSSVGECLAAGHEYARECIDRYEP
jgi:hypothetical protein